jgi:hypothetical protein
MLGTEATVLLAALNSPRGVHVVSDGMAQAMGRWIE